MSADLPGIRPLRRTAVMLGLLPLQLRLPAQLAAVDAGMLHSGSLTAAVTELYVAAPPWRAVRPYTIVSWTPFATADPERPTLIVQAALPLVARGRFWSTIDTGMTLYPFRAYRPDWSVSAFGGLRLPWAGLYLFTIPSTRPTRAWEHSLVAGLGRTLYFRR